MVENSSEIDIKTLIAIARSGQLSYKQEKVGPPTNLQSLVKRFVKEQNIKSGPHEVTSKQLYALFKTWAESREESKIPTIKSFGKTLRKVKRLPYKKKTIDRCYYINRRL